MSVPERAQMLLPEALHKQAYARSNSRAVYDTRDAVSLTDDAVTKA